MPRLNGFSNVPQATLDELKAALGVNEELPKFFPTKEMFSSEGRTLIRSIPSQGSIPEPSSELLALIAEKVGANTLRFD